MYRFRKVLFVNTLTDKCHLFPYFTWRIQSSLYVNLLIQSPDINASLIMLCSNQLPCNAYGNAILFSQIPFKHFHNSWLIFSRVFPLLPSSPASKLPSALISRPLALQTAASTNRTPEHHCKQNYSTLLNLTSCIFLFERHFPKIVPAPNTLRHILRFQTAPNKRISL